MTLTAEHFRIMAAAFSGELYHDQHGRWRIARADRPSFRCRRQLLAAGYLDKRHRLTERGLQVLRSGRGGGLLT